jgi:hypothetical protein
MKKPKTQKITKIPKNPKKPKNPINNQKTQKTPWAGFSLKKKPGFFQPCLHEVRAGLLHAEADGVGCAGPEAGERVGGHLEADLDVAVLGRHVRVMVVFRRDLEDKVPGQRAGRVPAQGDEGVSHCQRKDLDVEQLKKAEKVGINTAGNVSFSSVFRACFNQFLGTLSKTVSFYAPQDSLVTKDYGIEPCTRSLENKHC